MRKKNEITFETRKIIERLLKERRSITFISHFLKLSRSKVRYEIERLGISNYNAVEAQEQFENAIQPGRTGNRLTFEHRKIIESELKNHTSLTDIAKKLGFYRNTISVEVAKCGNNEYKAEIAQNITKKNATRKNIYSAYKETEKFADDIEALKMQIEILFEEIKEMKKGL